MALDLTTAAALGSGTLAKSRRPARAADGNPTRLFPPFHDGPPPREGRLENSTPRPGAGLDVLLAAQIAGYPWLVMSISQKIAEP